MSNECWSSGSASKMIHLLWQQRGFLDLEYNSEKRWTMLRFERALCVEKRESTLSFSCGCDTAVKSSGAADSLYDGESTRMMSSENLPHPLPWLCFFQFSTGRATLPHHLQGVMVPLPRRQNPQRQPLTVSLRKICGDYPAGAGVLRELLQNADDAGASTVVHAELSSPDVHHLS